VSPLTRRRLLGGVAATLAVPGCSWPDGDDPTLRLRNPAPEPAEVRIEAYRQHAGEARTEERSFEADVSVEASTARDVEVFTPADQYRVVVERGDRRVEFPTRPVCEEASTAVTLRPSGHVEYRVAFCEGPDRSGSSRES